MRTAASAMSGLGVGRSALDGDTRTPRAEPRAPGRVAILHDWLTGMRGGEKVLEAICELFPEAPIFTLVRVPGSVAPGIERHRIRTSPVQLIPGAGRLYRNFLPLYPAVVELFDLDGYDLVISSSHCAVKSVIRAGSATHLCYCHSPMRYAWDQFREYFGPEQVGAFRSRMLRPVMAWLARWDASTAGRVDRFLANSQYVAGRIRRYYNRESTVVYPPVDTSFFTPGAPAERSDRFVIVSALVPYKRVDVAIEACRRIGAPLTVVGRGPEEARLRQIAGADVQFLGWRSDEDVRALYRSARAVLLPGTEDFGMVPVEAQACGAPVVALGRGGALETVIDGATGTLAEDGTAESLADALSRLDRMPLDRAAVRANAEQFSRERFMTEFRTAVAHAIADREGRA